MRIQLISVLMVGLVGFSLRSPAEEPATKKYQVITPKDDRMNLVDINSRGEVTGAEWVEDKKDSNIIVESPFFARGQALTEIPLLKGYTSMFPAALSDGGTVVGRASKPGSFTKRVLLRNQAFLWDAKTGSRGLGTLEGDVASIACGISKDGAVISGYSVGENRIRVCVWEHLGDQWVGKPLPQTDRLGSTVVALSDDGRRLAAVDGMVPCLWTRDAASNWTREVLGGPGSLVPRGVNNSGVVVGFTFADSHKHAVMWTKSDGLKRLPEEKGFVQSEANDVNNDGVVVGGIEKDAGPGKELEPHAFIYMKGRLQLIEAGGPNFIVANAINDQWQITGTFERDDEEIK